MVTQSPAFSRESALRGGGLRRCLRSLRGGITYYKSDNYIVLGRFWPDTFRLWTQRLRAFLRRRKNINNSDTMKKKEFSGEYLAPKVKVVKMKARYQILAGSLGETDRQSGFTWNEDE